MVNKIKIGYAVVVLLCLLCLIMLAINVYPFLKGIKENSSLVYNEACMAPGVIKINRHTLEYVSGLRLNPNGTGAITLSGKVYQGDDYLGVLGLQTTFKYTATEGLLHITSIKVLKQIENEVSDEVMSKVVPPVYYIPGASQNVAFMKFGNGYRLAYNAYPTTYCY